MKSEHVCRLDAAPGWQRLALVSDLHLGPDAPRTTEAFLRWLETGGREADALFILGDLFEAWVGDDLLQAIPADEVHARVCAGLKACAGSGRALFALHGNRDFLLGSGFEQASGATLLDDPCLLRFGGQSIVLSHGDALCLDDAAYQQWRALCRQPAWQQQALAQPLAARLQQAAALRERSRAAQAKAENWADADPLEAARWLTAAGSAWLIHGHTHRPREHWQGASLRQVLSDWDLDSRHPRAQVLWLERSADCVDVHRQNLV